MADEEQAKTNGGEAGKRELKEQAPVTTRHEATIRGQTLAYDVTAGLMPLRNAKDEIEAQIFFVAYTLDNADGAAPRPLTFAFNGGPGSSSIWLHMGALGPKRVHLNADGTMPPPPFRMVDNDESWLAETDLVFIDPVGTGYSRAATPELEEKYYGYKGDIESVGEFIRLYLTRYRRWSSPLFLAGESYGTLRAAGLAGHLVERGIALNGITLVSAVLSYATLDMWGIGHNDLPYTLFLPSFAATAWYHKRLPDEYQSRELTDFLAEVEEYAMGDYLLALVQGDAIANDERAEVVRRVAGYTGLDERFVDNSNLRIQIMRFCKELLRDEKRTVGRLDSRFTGVDTLAVTEMPEVDPSMVHPGAPFTAMVNDYLRGALKFESDLVYETLSMAVNQKWKFDSVRNGYLDTSAPLRTAFNRNPHLKVLVAYGYYDLATPYYAIQYTMNHLGLEPSRRGDISYAAYEAGHMMYIDDGCRQQFREDVVAFYGDALPG